MQGIMGRGSLVVTMASLLTACQPAAGRPTGLTEADRAAIRKVADDAAAIMNSPARDFDAYTQAYYAPDAIVLPPNAPIVTGHEAISAFFKSLPPVAAIRTVVEQTQVEGWDDTAWVQGSYTMAVTLQDGTPINDTGKYIEIWRKQGDGSWRVIRDISNSDIPATPPGGSVGG